MISKVLVLALLAVILVIGLYLTFLDLQHPGLEPCSLREGAVEPQVSHYAGRFEELPHWLGGIGRNLSAGAHLFKVSKGSKAPSPNDVLVIKLSAADGVPDEVMLNVCVQRGYLAGLIEALNNNPDPAKRPSVIVLDKFFSRDACGAQDQNTKDLECQLRETPGFVVIGRATHRSKNTSGGSCLVPSDDLFKDGDNCKAPNGVKSEGCWESNPGKVWHGLTRINQDTRKIPLGWRVYKDNNESKDSLYDAPSLSLRAAVVAGTDSAVIGNVVEHPFFPTQEIEFNPRTVSAGDFNCERHPKDKWTCKPCVPLESMGMGTLPKPELPKVVIIGDTSEYVDRHNLLGQPISGVNLQARYIHRLLNKDYLTPLDGRLNTFVLVLWILVVYLIFWLIPIGLRWIEERWIGEHQANVPRWLQWVWLVFLVLWVVLLLVFAKYEISSSFLGDILGVFLLFCLIPILFVLAQRLGLRWIEEHQPNLPRWLWLFVLAVWVAGLLGSISSSSWAHFLGVFLLFCPIPIVVLLALRLEPELSALLGTWWVFGVLTLYVRLASQGKFLSPWVEGVSMLAIALKWVEIRGHELAKHLRKKVESQPGAPPQPQRPNAAAA